MDRRSFFKFSGIFAAVPAVAATKLLAEEPAYEIPVEEPKPVFEPIAPENPKFDEFPDIKNFRRLMLTNSTSEAAKFFGAQPGHWCLTKDRMYTDIGPRVTVVPINYRFKAMVFPADSRKPPQSYYDTESADFKRVQKLADTSIEHARWYNWGIEAHFLFGEENVFMYFGSKTLRRFSAELHRRDAFRELKPITMGATQVSLSRFTWWMPTIEEDKATTSEPKRLKRKHANLRKNPRRNRHRKRTRQCAAKCHPKP